MAKHYKYFFLALVAGLLAALAYPVPGYWPLMWVAFIPLFFALRDGMFVFWKGLTAGMMFHLITLRWILDTDLQASMGFTHRWQEVAILMTVWIASAFVMGVWWGVFARLIRSRLYLAPAVFVGTEFLRSIGFGVFWFGKGMLFGPHWTMGNIAYAFSDNAWMLFLASYGGIYAVTLLVVSIQTALFFAISKRRWTYTGMLVALIFCISIVPLPQKSPPTHRIVHVSLLQTDRHTKSEYSSEELLSYFNDELRMLRTIKTEHPETEIVAFPEANGFFNNLATFVSTSDLVSYFKNLFPEAVLLASNERTTMSDGTFFSRVYFLDTHRGIIGTYDKRLLTPGGEYLSTSMRFFARIFSGNLIGYFEGIRELTPGTSSRSFVTWKDGISVSSVVCSELFSPSIVREASGGSNLILGHVSYGIFRSGTSLEPQVRVASRFRAAENGTTIAVAANAGRSYVYTGGGMQTSLSQNKNPQIITASVDIASKKSWYTVYGDWPVLILSLAMYGSSLIKKRRNEQ